MSRDKGEHLLKLETKIYDLQHSNLLHWYFPKEAVLLYFPKVDVLLYFPKEAVLLYFPKVVVLFLCIAVLIVTMEKLCPTK